ncbi:MAG: ATP-binding protein [Lachnospira sp.]|nr:ATP-binding protein [Lachnospira sp.]
MGRHSIKFKIMLLISIIVFSMVGILLFANNAIAENYYLKDKRNSMLLTYDKIDDIITKYDNGELTEAEMNDNIEQITTSCAISTIVVNSDWTVVYINTRGEADMLDRLRMSIFNNDIFKSTTTESETSEAESAPAEDESKEYRKEKPDNLSEDKAGKNPNIVINMDGSGYSESREIISQTDQYTMQKVFDSRLNDDYYELWGTISGGDSIMLRVAIQGIKDNVTIFNAFIRYVGIAIFFIGIIAAFILSNYITRPIKQLSGIAERMSNLDFNAKYQGNDRSEIGVLGKSMNNMAHKLEDNIAQLKAANLELQRDIERKNQQEEMRTDFLSNVSHELKTPIALIQGYAEGLKEGISDDPESMNFYCDVIMDEAGKMNNMVKKLLTLNQIEFGNEELVMERFNICELISSIVNANELRAEQKDISIHFSQKDEQIYVWSDEYKIEEVVTNYVTNAINHCDYDKQIDIKIEPKGENVRVSVFNTGKQIPKEDIDNIWIKFYKVDKARTREYGGNGIGLSIVKAICDSCGKEYGVSNVENGVVFWFDLDAKNVV